jgi:hypothetical protein
MYIYIYGLKFVTQQIGHLGHVPSFFSSARMASNSSIVPLQSSTASLFIARRATESPAVNVAASEMKAVRRIPCSDDSLEL